MRPDDAESTLSLAVAFALTLQMAASAEPVAPTPSPAAPSILSVPPPFAGPQPGPRRIDDLARPLTGAVPQGSYEARVRGAVERAQTLQGPRDGGWIVVDAAGARLFRFQIVDPGFASRRIEGVWSDLRAAGPDATGFFTDVARSGVTVTLQFARAGGGEATLTLQPGPQGGYVGEMVSVRTGAAASRAQVTMTRP